MCCLGTFSSETKKEVKIRNESSSGKKEKKKEKPRKPRKSRKFESDSHDSDVQTCRSKSKRKTNRKSKNLDHGLKKLNNERKRKIELNMDSKIKRNDGKGGTKNTYINFDLKSGDSKRKTKSDGGLRNDRRDRKQKSESEISHRNIGIERNDRKRNTGDTLTKLSRTVENYHSSSKKRKIKHWE